MTKPASKKSRQSPSVERQLALALVVLIEDVYAMHNVEADKVMEIPIKTARDVLNANGYGDLKSIRSRVALIQAQIAEAVEVNDGAALVKLGAELDRAKSGKPPLATEKRPRKTKAPKQIIDKSTGEAKLLAEETPQTDRGRRYVQVRKLRLDWRSSYWISLSCGWVFGGCSVSEMISASQTAEPSTHVKSRAKKMHVRTLSPFTYLVIPEPGKVPRIVHFDLCQDSGVVRIECYARETGIGCEANTYSVLCSHVHAACDRLLANAKRKGAPQPVERVTRIRAFAQDTLDSMDQRELIPK